MYNASIAAVRRGLVGTTYFRVARNTAEKGLRRRSTTSSGSNVTASLSGSDVYETEVATNEYLQFHYATDSDLCPFVEPSSGIDTKYAAALGHLMSFPVACAEKLAQSGGCSEASRGSRALDVGCSVGRTSFELSKYYDTVVGLDFSQVCAGFAGACHGSGSRLKESMVLCVLPVAFDFLFGRRSLTLRII